ncbi:MAG TPA: hypothetical protein VMZ26_09335 [Pyrinomonadaceae bacterium]|nr:hypothetical protein [Pyrinomonadaceae bacterium]
MRKNSAFLSEFLSASTSKRKQLALLRRSTTSQLCTVCEIVKNLLHNPTLNLKLDERQLRALKSRRAKLRKLADRRTSHDEKRRILQSGRGVLLPLLASIAAPLIARLFGVN